MPSLRVLPWVAMMGIVFPGEMIAQVSPNPGHRIFVGSGYVELRNQDLAGSRTVYAGRHMPVRIGYVYAGGRTVHQINANLTRTTLTGVGDGVTTEASIVGIDLEYRYAGRPEHKWHAAPTAVWSTSVALRSYGHGGGEVWEGSSMLGLGGEAGVTSGANHLVAGPTVLLLGYVGRPPYSTENDEVYRAYYDPSRLVTRLGRLVHVGNSPNIEFRLTWVRELGSPLELRTSYVVRWSEVLDSPQTTSVHSGLVADLSLEF